MSANLPVLPDTAPFSAEQRAWLNGLFAGLFSRSPGSISQLSTPTSQPTAALQPLTILFGSQTGAAESLAKRAAKEAGRRHFAATVLDMAECDLARLAAEKNLLVITSTYGDGAPPDNARALHAQLGEISSSKSQISQGPHLSAMRFSVCALGDTNYTHFCKCGAEFDTALEKLGATRVLPRADCDVDYEEKFNTWLHAALTALASPEPAIPSATPPLAPAPASAPAPATTPATAGYSRANPFPALLLASRNLNAAGSAKQVHHVEFDLAGSGLAYEAGDALGVFPHNCPALVSEILIALGCDGEEAVPAPDGSTTSLRRALTELYDLGRPTPELLALLSSPVATSASESPPTRDAPPHQLIDVLLAHPDFRPAPTDFVRVLKKLQPRLYSISSSPRAHAGRVHLTVGAVRYDLHGRARKGVCSTFLVDRAVAGESRVGLFVHQNKNFRPPASPDTPMIMIGPGTGIAPFRGFLHQRRAAGARGRNWLFFGDQHAATDFLYRDELDALRRDGTLTRLDTAFSRDQPEKIYVQHRMFEHAADLYAWLESGAHLYVCGDATRMARDVDAALHTLVERAGNKSTDQAAAYVQSLKTTRRYCRDVY